ncbi:MAG: hypothetical protein ACK5Z4_11635, partial [Planctomyces sp.]
MASSIDAVTPKRAFAAIDLRAFRTDMGHTFLESPRAMRPSGAICGQAPKNNVAASVPLAGRGGIMPPEDQ